MDTSLFEFKLRKVIASNLLLEANKFKESLIEVYLDSYDKLLSEIVVDKDSLANPIYFVQDYKKALDNFKYFESDVEDVSTFRYRIPTEDTFDFSGRLGFLKLLINGVVGTYYELPQPDYIKLVDTISGDRFREYVASMPKFFDDDTPEELRFYLLYYVEDLHKIVSTILGKKLVVFPFSDTEPIDIFEDGIEYFELNIDKLINKIIQNSITFVKQGNS